MQILTLTLDSPGPVYTPIQVDTREAEDMENFGSASSIGRPGQPSEVATSFIFLASADASLFCKSPFTLSTVTAAGLPLVSANSRIDGQVLHCYPLGD